jgi:transposase
VSLFLKPGVRVFAYSEAIDMRSGFQKLQSLVAEKMQENLFEGNLFLFLGKNPRRAKILVFDGTGLLLTTKRLDQGSFMSAADFLETKEIALDELRRLLDGANLSVVFAARRRVANGEEVA